MSASSCTNRSMQASDENLQVRCSRIIIRCVRCTMICHPLTSDTSWAGNLILGMVHVLDTVLGRFEEPLGLG